MLDYKTSRKRMLIALALVLIALAIIPAMTARQLTTSDGRGEYSGQMQAVGPSKAPELVVQTKEGLIRCPMVRCRYDGWQDDVGKHVQVVVDSRRSPVEIHVAGETKLNAEDVYKRWLGYVFVAVSALCAGGVLLILGVRKK